MSEALHPFVVFTARMLLHEGLSSLEFCRRKLERRVGLHGVVKDHHCHRPQACKGNVEFPGEGHRGGVHGWLSSNHRGRSGGFWKNWGSGKRGTSDAIQEPAWTLPRRHPRTHLGGAPGSSPGGTPGCTPGHRRHGSLDRPSPLLGPHGYAEKPP